MRFSRASLLVVVLVAALPAALPGIAEQVERLIPGDDCTEDCPADSAEGKCGTSCDQCACCARTMTAAFLPYRGPGAPGRFEAAPPVVPTRALLVLPEGVYHPPRA